MMEARRNMGRRVALLSLVALASHRAGVRADDTLNGVVPEAFGESCYSAHVFVFGVLQPATESSWVEGSG